MQGAETPGAKGSAAEGQRVFRCAVSGTRDNIPRTVIPHGVECCQTVKDLHVMNSVCSVHDFFVLGGYI